MKKSTAKKPVKKTTEELMTAISEAISKGEYYFTDHGDKRSKSRKKVGDLEIIKILESSDSDQIRIVLSFDTNGMPIITVINIDEVNDE